MCMYCEEECELGTDYDWHGDVSPFIRNNELYVYRNNSFGYESKVCEICFCPMCGKRLGDD